MQRAGASNSEGRRSASYAPSGVGSVICPARIASPAADIYKVWTWDPAYRRPYRGYPKKQLPMWHQYRVEMYPHFGQLSGICDKYGNELEFPSAFRLSRRDGRPRGIVKIKKEGQP